MSEVWRELSVLIPAHDSAATIGRALASIKAQSLQPAATIVIDDGSSDDTATLADEFGARTLRLERAGGAAAARNVGLRAATTSYCAFLDADDAWNADHLRTLRRATEAHPEAVLWMSGSARETASGESAGRVPAARREQRASVFDLLTQKVRPTTSATVVRQAAALSAGGFDEHEDFRPASCEDLDLWLRLAAIGEAWALPTTTTRYVVSDGRRDPERLKANERARIGAVERALVKAGSEIPDPSLVWAITWRDLGLWHLKHGEKREARRRFTRALRTRPLDPKSALLVLLTLLPEGADRLLRRMARAGYRQKAS
jgi:glycosyltransferase involved in cell wall biosynthesis